MSLSILWRGSLYTDTLSYYTKIMNKLQSEKIILASPLSFIGSVKRIWRITETSGALKTVAIPMAIILVVFAWVIVSIWYVIIYIIFGVLFIPYRLLRRSGRKQKQEKLRHREILDTIAKNRNL